VTWPLRLAPPLPLPLLCEACGKHRYATRETAELIIALSANRREPGEKTEIRAYYDHGWWHLTSRDDYGDAATAAGEGNEHG
jgi:hypothetical protein